MCRLSAIEEKKRPSVGLLLNSAAEIRENKAFVQRKTKSRGSICDDRHRADKHSLASHKFTFDYMYKCILYIYINYSAA